ncbi:MAG: RNA polymerase sigma factor, partial [Gordonibacter urolithinfaciens]
MHIPFKRKTGRTDAADNPCPLRSDAFLKRAMDAWGDTVYRVALAQTGSPSDADDVYQDVFMRLLEHTAAFESDEHLKAWLLRVTINRCHDIARLSWNRRTGGLEQEHIDIPAPDAFRADIWEVVGALPPDLRTTVHLHYAEGYSTEE